jgi:RNA polymerase sigma-70 factor (ECF subfamily)
MLHRTKTRLPFECKAHYRIARMNFGLFRRNVDSLGAIIGVGRLKIGLLGPSGTCRPFNFLSFSHLATERELSDFLKSVEKRAFKRSVYHVRNDESALDIVQDSMMKLAEHYGHKPVEELPMLFQRILSNCTLDWFRRQKTQKALFSTMSDFESSGDDDDFDLLETLSASNNGEQNESAESQTERAQTLREIEIEVQQLPARQREAFLMRYWEDMDVAETAAAMGCSQGSVKTHCSRAVQALGKALSAKGIRL